MVEWSSLAGALLDRAVRSDAGDDGEPDAEVAEAREALRAALLEPTPIAAVVSNAELDIGAAEVLAVAVTVEADPKLQRRLAQRHGDSMSTRLTVHDVAVLFVPDHDVLMAIGPDAPLRRAALVDVVGDGPWGAQSIVVHPTVMWAFAGEASVDPQLPPGTRVHEAPAGHPNADARTRFVAVTGEDRVRRLQAATAAAAATRYLVTPVPTDDAEWPALVREATLVGAGIVIELDGGFLPPVGRRWIERAAHLTWIVSSRTEVSIDEMPVRPWLDLVAPSTEPSREEWAETLGDTERTHRLTAAQLELVGRARAAGPGDLDTAVRRLAGGAIDTLARRVRPTAAWDDIVVSPDRLELLREIVDRSRHADAVFDEWGFQAVPSSGVVALFAGPSGTGKTMAAEVIAGELGLDLYKLDLSAVVSKYIGETEKNLERDLRRGGGRRPACCSSTRPTRCSASAPRSRTPTTGTPTSRSPTCCSGSRRTTGWSCSPPTSSATSTTRSSAGSTCVSSSPLPEEAERRRSGSATCRRGAGAPTSTPDVPGPAVQAVRRRDPQRRAPRGVPGRRSRTAIDMER